MQYFAADLPVGSMAVGLFDLNDKDAATVTVKWSDLNPSGSRSVRDLWRQKNLGDFDDQFSMNLAPHGAELIKIAP
jgi:alpha-galactosidase